MKRICNPQKGDPSGALNFWPNAAGQILSGLITKQKAGVIGGIKRNPADVFNTGGPQHIGKLLFGIGLARIRAQKHIQGKQGREKGAVHAVIQNKFVNNNSTLGI